jgi:hypothetical protein
MVLQIVECDFLTIPCMRKNSIARNIAASEVSQAEAAVHVGIDKIHIEE